jgi:hypothetical protein
MQDRTLLLSGGESSAAIKIQKESDQNNHFIYWIPFESVIALHLNPEAQ